LIRKFTNLWSISFNILLSYVIVMTTSYISEEPGSVVDIFLFVEDLTKWFIDIVMEVYTDNNFDCRSAQNDLT
jgi:hypothetical protein